MDASSCERAAERPCWRDELILHYQPKVDLASGAMKGAEALIRWQHPERGLLQPVEFVPWAEQSGWIHVLGDWIIFQACRQLREWLDAGLPVVPVAVNCSARQLQDSGFVHHVGRALDVFQLDPRLLEIELTESAMMVDVETAIRLMAGLRELGVKIALDDFGTGYSSLSYLKRLPIGVLKIDRSLVQDVADHGAGAIICRSVIGLAHELGMDVIGEGVETEEQVDGLRRQHCDQMQGYYCGRPAPASNFAALL
jgi:EAL domain-containing protein (putative c-di-GMP-specific phosphodiesterase class I)